MQLIPTVVLIVAVAAALDVAMSEFSPGAADAAATAVALTRSTSSRRPARPLSPPPPAPGGGARRRAPENAVLLELGPCTGGAPAWRTRQPQLARAVAHAAGALRIPEPGHRPRGLGTRTPWLRIACLDERGIVARSHQGDDTPANADPAAADRAIDLALGTVDALDAELRVDATRLQ